MSNNNNIENIIKENDDNILNYKNKYKHILLKKFIIKKEKIISNLLCKNYYRFYIKCYIKENNINEDKNKEIEEKIIDLKREKQLKDLFYNKIIERKNYIHKKFSKFYYKGIMNEMKNKGKNNDKKINEVENKNINNIENKNINNIENKNINEENKNISNDNKIEAKIEEVKNINKDEKPKIIDIKLYKQKQLKNLFYNKILEMKDYIHNRFTKFYYKGLLYQMKYPELFIKNNNNEIKNKQSIEDNQINHKNSINKLNINEDNLDKNSKNSITEERSKMRNKVSNLKKIIKNKDKQNKDVLKKYFEKFYKNILFKQLLLQSKNQQINYQYYIENKLNIKLNDEEINQLNIENINMSLEFCFYIYKRKLFLLLYKSFIKWKLISKILRLNPYFINSKKKKKKKIKKNKTKINNNQNIIKIDTFKDYNSQQNKLTSENISDELEYIINNINAINFNEI